ncbi:hypothetical protein [Alistipes communis]|uniref:hypothetical protein n=1 Tax=Alistipes communis TaxID=2585118 RepID=UPI0026DBEA66|nr:hypothetical protein [Alistipes communis]
MPLNLQAEAVSLSNAGLIIKRQTDWYGSTQNCHRSFSGNTHICQAIKREKQEETDTVISEPSNIFSQLIQRYFSLAGRQTSDDFFLLYKAAKARIWLKLSPPIFFQLFI